MLDNIEVLYHSSIKISKDKVIYIDPYKINENYNDADIIFITHDHYDHYSYKDIEKIKKYDTKYIVPCSLYNELKTKGIKEENIIKVIPNEKYDVDNIKFETIPAYNKNKRFHPKENNWVGYIIEIDKERYYIAGDTDITEENQNVNCDIAFLPVGGTYTMDYKEAATLANIIKPKITVPIHYGSVVGSKKDAEKFINLLDKEIKGVILIK